MKQVGVCPPAQESAHRRLFTALAEVFPASFLPRQPGEWAGLDALIYFTDELAGEKGASVSGLRQLIIHHRPAKQAQAGSVKFADPPELDRRLRGRTLDDRQARGQAPLTAKPDETVLAYADGAPCWLTQRAAGVIVDRVSIAPPLLKKPEVLRERLGAGDYLTLLPLVHFLREVCVSELWTPPPLRAAFIFDDPNLRATSYGHLRFPELIAHAEKHNYHAAIATVPLDAWGSRQKAVDLFRNNPERLSLLYHGNDHLSGELGRPLSESAAQALLAQSRRRIRSLERRTGLFVDRVMAAPHGVCSENMMRQMPRLGFEAACISRPYPWLDRAPAEKLLAQWPIADLVAGGFPVIARYKIADPREDLVWRAYLDQPLIVYGHHGDLAQGLDILAEAAELINSLGEVKWQSLGSIARSNFASRREDELLRIRPYARRFVLEDLSGVAQVQVEKPPEWEEESLLVCGEQRLPFTSETGDSGAMIPVQGEERLEILLEHPAPLDPANIPAPPQRIWPFVRRLLTESRDRLSPLLGR